MTARPSWGRASAPEFIDLRAALKKSLRGAAPTAPRAAPVAARPERTANTNRRKGRAA